MQIGLGVGCCCDSATVVSHHSGDLIDNQINWLLARLPSAAETDVWFFEIFYREAAHHSDGELTKRVQIQL